MHLLRPLVAAALLLASPAAATTLPLVVDSGQSFLISEAGPIESLAGTLRFEVGSLPVGPGNTTFDLVALDLVTSSGGTIVLDPDQPSPGLGVLSPAGTFLIPTLYLRLSKGGDVIDLALPDVTGSVEYGPSGSASCVENEFCLGNADFAVIVALTTAFSVETPEGLVDVTLRAEVPEPASAVLAALGIAALAAHARRRAPEDAR